MKFNVEIEYDQNSDPPWEQQDGHGPVSEWTTRAKRPGEWPLVRDNRRHRFYNFAEAMRIAKRDTWDAPPYGTGTKGERALRAVKADFENMSRWCNDDWHWVGIIVTEEDSGETASLWGIESDAYDYLKEVERELISEIIQKLLDDLKDHRQLELEL